MSVANIAICIINQILVDFIIMRINELARLFDEGACKDARIVEDIFNGWLVEVKLSKTGWEAIERKRDNEIASYKSLNAAYQAIRDVGFRCQGLSILK